MLVLPRRRILRAALERAVERGELREDLDLELVMDMLVGPMVHRVLISGADLTAAAGMPPRVLETLLRGLSPSG